MNKKIFALLSSAFLLAGCGGNNQNPGEETHNHSFNESWSTNNSSHWHAASCNHTELSKDLGNHIDENKDGKCDVCDFTLPVEEEPHEHSFAETWSKDETNHWRESTCDHDVQSELAAHDYGNDNICDVCGYERLIPEPAHEHAFASAWTTNEKSHWHAATCEHTDLTKDLGSHVDSNSNHICDVCEYVMSVCVDEDNDHLCDICGETFSNHVDSNNDHYCDICEVKYTECVDSNLDNYCDVCGEVIDISKEPVSKETFIQALQALRGNFSADVQDELIFRIQGLTCDYISKSTAEHDKNNVSHAHELEKYCRKTVDIEEFAGDIELIYGDTPTQEQIDEFVKEYLYDDFFAEGFYQYVKGDEEIIHEEGSPLYSIEFKQTDSIGARFDVLKEDYNYYHFDYLDLYEVNHDNIYNERLALGKQGHFRETSVTDEYTLIDLFCDSSKKFESASYFANNKTFTFEGQVLRDLIYGDEYDFSFPGAYFIGNIGDGFKDGQLVIDFTSDNQLDYISFEVETLDNSIIKLDVDLTLGGEDIVIPEFEDEECNHPDCYRTVYDYDLGHIYYCNKCCFTIGAEVHDYDEEGFCKVCKHQAVEYRTLDGELIEGNECYKFYMEVNAVTGKIIQFCLPDGEFSRYNVSELGDLAKFEGINQSVWAPDDFTTLDTYYVLEGHNENVENGCLSTNVYRSTIYKIDHGVASCFMGPVYSVESKKYHSIAVNPEDLTKIKGEDCVLEGTCYCENCGQVFDCYCYASVGVWECQDYIDKTMVQLFVSYKDEENNVYESSLIEVEPIYDENGFDFYTGYHSYIQPYYVGEYQLGYLFYERFGNVGFGGEEFIYCDRTKEGDTDVWTLTGTPEDVVIQARIDFDEVVDPESCFVFIRETILVYSNGEIVDTIIAYQPTKFGHSYEYIEGSYHFDELLQMYIFEICCPDCEKTFTVYEAEIKVDDHDDCHYYTGHYYDEVLGEPMNVEIEIKENCIPNPDDSSHCLICGQEIL